MNDSRSRLQFTAAAFLFGTNGLLAAYIPLTGAQTVLLRTVLGSLFLAAAVALTGRFDVAALKRDAVAVTAGGAALGLNWVLLFEAYRQTSVSIATLVYNCGPMLVLALSPVLFGERLTRGRLAALAAVAAGLVCVSGNIDPQGAGASGILTAAGAALFYAAVIVCNKRVTALSGLHCALYELIVSFFVVLAYVLLSGGQIPAPPTASWLPILWLGLVNTGLAYYLYFSSLQKLPGQTASLLCYLDPLTSLVLSAAFLHERLLPVQLLGAALILGGAVLGEVGPPRRMRR